MSSKAGAGHREQVMVHPLEVLADDLEAGMRHQVMDVGDPAGDRVLDRDHRPLGLAVAHRRERLLERSVGTASRCGQTWRQARCE